MTKRIAYVTGGMGGIGTAICQRLARDGFIVVAGCGPNSPRKAKWLEQQKALGFDFVPSEGNVGDWESTKAAFDKVKAEVGEVDVLVNNAGITRDVVFRKMTRADWDAVIDTNLTSLFNVTKQVIDGMVDRGWGRVGQGWLARLYDGAGAGSGDQGRDGEHRVAGLYRHRHGESDSSGCARQDRRYDSGQAPG